MVPATCDMASSWPNIIKIGVVKMNIGRIMNVVNDKTIHDLWR